MQPGDVRYLDYGELPQIWHVRLLGGHISFGPSSPQTGMSMKRKCPHTIGTSAGLYTVAQVLEVKFRQASTQPASMASGPFQRLSISSA